MLPDTVHVCVFLTDPKQSVVFRDQILESSLVLNRDRQVGACLSACLGMIWNGVVLFAQAFMQINHSVVENQPLSG